MLEPRGVIEAALPDPTQRDIALRQLISSCRAIATIAPSAWAVTLLTDGFRLNVGDVEALTLQRETLHVCLAADASDPLLQGLPVLPGIYRRVGRTHCYYEGQPSDFEAAKSLLEPLHLEYLRAASMTPTGKLRVVTRFGKFHSPELLSYAARVTNSAAPEFAPTQAFNFKIGAQYSRNDVFDVLGIPHERGGQWFTGHRSFGPDAFIFCNVGSPGRTGHEYDNHFLGEQLVWYARGLSKVDHPSIQELMAPAGRLYVFYRENDRDAFTFAGVGRPFKISDETPVKVIWTFEDVLGLPPPGTMSEEIPADEYDTVLEGAKKTVVVNVYERNPSARRRCLDRWGAVCQVCNFDFGATFGELGSGFIHVHHLKPLGELGGEYELDPINDLAPVCPNCHAMLHRKRPALTIEELRQLLLARGVS